MAQSLDLPPSAARWRHEQRAKHGSAGAGRAGGAARRAGAAGAATGGGAAGAGSSGAYFDLTGVGGGAAAGPDGQAVGGDEVPDLKSRVAGMLEAERGEGWEE